MDTPSKKLPATLTLEEKSFEMTERAFETLRLNNDADARVTDAIYNNR